MALALAEREQVGSIEEVLVAVAPQQVLAGSVAGNAHYALTAALGVDGNIAIGERELERGAQDPVPLQPATLSSIAGELESGRITLLGSEPWLSTHYGIVRLKNHPLTSASVRFRDFILEAERTATLEEEPLLARPAAGRADVPRSRGRKRRGIRHSQ